MKKTTFFIIFAFSSLTSAYAEKLKSSEIKSEAIFSCDAPENVTVSNITSRGADFSWTASATTDLTQFYQYTISTSTTPAVGPTTVNTSVSSAVNFPNLNPNTTYYFHVRSFCSGAWSDWAAPVSFMTFCEVFEVPYSLNFETVTVPNLPVCTSNVNLGTGGNWQTSQSPGSGFISKTLQFTGNASNGDAWFFTQGIQLDASKRYTFKFKYGNNSTTSIEKLKAFSGTSPSAASMTNSFADLQNISGGTVGNYNTGGPVPVQTTGVYYFGFHAMSDANQGNLYVDDIVVEEWTCGLPINPSIADITATGVAISWGTPSGNLPQVFEYAIITSSTPPAENQGRFFPGNSVTVNDLLPETNYYLYVRASCSGVSSGWTPSINFTTAALSVSDLAFKSFKLYPNPANDFVTILNGMPINKVEIRNLLGQKIIESNHNTLDVKLDISSLQQGYYLLSVYSEGTNKTVRLLKK